MSKKANPSILDGNEAAASVAFRTNEVIAIYPITPASPMGALADGWAAAGERNIWGAVPTVIEMQSEGGAAGAVHGALMGGSLATTFTASQGLLLMIPNMYKIAGELTPMVLHVAARTLATHALSIFGDHSDVMAARQTGFALMASNSPQEAMDFAAIAQAATLRSRIPFLHFFDGFRTSHELTSLDYVTDETLRALLATERLSEHRGRGLTPERPVLRGSAQNPDAFFQGREAVNPFYDACPDITQDAMNRFAALTGRQYHLYEYHGPADASRVIVMMGSGSETVHETVDFLNRQGEKVGLVKVRLYRPFDARRFAAALPKTTRAIAVLDRTKEPGAAGEPLYLDTITALHEALSTGWEGPTDVPKIVGGRYGLSSKEFTPGMVKAVFDNLTQTQPKNHFTAGIRDDVTLTSLDFDPEFSVTDDGVFQAQFYGLGSDGTVGANKNSIKIIGHGTDNYTQGYFEYDSKKAGAVTISHLRFGPHPIRSTYKVTRADLVACHQWNFLARYDLLGALKVGGTFILNSPYGPDEVWEHLSQPVQEEILRKRIRFYVIDANRIAHENELGGRINTTMQVAFFAAAGILPLDRAIAAIKDSIRETYGKKGAAVVDKNLAAVDQARDSLHEVSTDGRSATGRDLPPALPSHTPPFVRDVLGELMARRGDQVPVSAFPVDGTFPTGTAAWEKRDLAQEIPVWEAGLCIQCGKCAMVCPHGVIRIKAYEPRHLAEVPTTFKSCDAHDREWRASGLKYTIQVAPEDCTACTLCVDVCPPIKKEGGRKALTMQPQPPLKEAEAANWDFFLTLPDRPRTEIKPGRIGSLHVLPPLLEFSGACAGCGETPYLSLLTRLFGDRLLIANATGCSSIYGGNLPTCPWTVNQEGRGPAWANSLFEDNAEFGLGLYLSVQQREQFARQLVMRLASEVGEELAAAILAAEQKDEASIAEQRRRVATLKERLGRLTSEEARLLLPIADVLVKQTVWAIGGDGWAYDIGYGGLDHVLSGPHPLRLLVLDTEVYSNTGGQRSKATQRAATAQFAISGKPDAKKDLGLMAMAYPHVYVASVAMGASDIQTLRAFQEAEAHPGPALLIAYSACIEHGIDMATAMQQDLMVASGQWILFRRNPGLATQGKNPLILDSKAPTRPVRDFLFSQQRFRRLATEHPESADRLFAEAQADVDRRWLLYQHLANQPAPDHPLS